MCLAATSHIFCDMVQAPTHFVQPLQMGFPKIVHLTHFESLGNAFMKTYEGERIMNAKKINMEKIILVFFEHVCLSVCGCTVHKHDVESWGSVLWLERGHSDYYRGAVFLLTEFSVNSDSGSNTQLHFLLTKQMHKDILKLSF